MSEETHEQALPVVFGVLGDPVAHSRSPAMHNAAFTALGLPHRYAAFHVRPAALADALAGARALGLGGLNLTVPHKRAALALVDELTPRARRIGAVNTIILRAGRLVGDNTDGLGFAAALRELFEAKLEPAARGETRSTPGTASLRRHARGEDPGARRDADSRHGPARAPRVREAVVLGAGGAARAVIDALARDREHGLSVEHVRWVTRNPAALAEQLHSGAPLRAVEITGYERLELARVELLVNCTTVGMRGGPARFPTPIEPARLAPGARVVDIVYPRPPGGLLDRAAAAGCHVQDGLVMLHWQGVFALERWLGRPLPSAAVAAMRAAL